MSTKEEVAVLGIDISKAKFDLSAVNEKGETLAYHAMLSGDEPLVLDAIEHGADVTKTGVSAVSSIAVAVNKNMPKIKNGDIFP